MAKIQVTAQQRANAIEARDVMWPSVPEKNVDRDLEDWRVGESSTVAPTCNTIACFGGWVEWYPKFREQIPESDLKGGFAWSGVVALFHGALPTMRLSDGSQRVLPEIVNTRGHFPSDIGFTGTDHALVLNRLNWLIENSEVKA